MKRIGIVIDGKVQGVFFRKYTLEFCREHQLTGFVKNLPNGTVYIEAQGTPEPLELLKKWCYKGSPLSVVRSVKFSEMECLTESEFHIVKG